MTGKVRYAYTPLIKTTIQFHIGRKIETPPLLHVLVGFRFGEVCAY